MSDQDEQVASPAEQEELKDLTWKNTNSKARGQFQALARGVMRAINEDAEWLELVSESLCVCVCVCVCMCMCVCV